MHPPPLFSSSKGNNHIWALVKAKLADKELDVEKLIETTVDKAKGSAGGILCSQDAGKLTFAIYSLLEILLEYDLGDLADSLLASKQDLFRAAAYTAIGIEIGRILPEEVSIETDYVQYNPDIRKDKETLEKACDRCDK